MSRGRAAGPIKRSLFNNQNSFLRRTLKENLTLMKRAQVYHMARSVTDFVQFQHIGGPTDGLHLFTKGSGTGLGLATVAAALLSSIRQTSIPSQVLLASTSTNVLHGRSSEKAFIKCLGVSIAFLTTAESLIFGE